MPNLDSLEPIAGEPNYQFVQGDIGDFEHVRTLLGEGQPAAIINFAAESHVDRSIDGPREFVKTNVLGHSSFFSRHSTIGEDSMPTAKSVSLPPRLDRRVYGSLGPTGKFTETTPISAELPLLREQGIV